MNANHPLTKLSAAEASLVSSIAAAARLDAVGTSAVGSAIDRLRASAHAASVRLSEAGSVVASIAGDVLACALGEAMALGMAMNADEGSVVNPISEPATSQVEPVNGYVYDEPSDMGVPLSLPSEPDTLRRLPEHEVLARLPFLFSGQRPADPEPTPEVEPERRTGLPLVDAFLDIAREAEAESKGVDDTDTLPSDAAFSPDGPTLFDRHGNPDDDPTAVLVKSHAVPYVAPTQTPARKRKSR